MNQVSQGQYKIIPKSEGPLETSGLATCSAISFIINETHTFMAHIDAKTNVDRISNKIISQFGSHLQISDVQIWYGDGILEYTSELTQKLIKKFATQLGIKIEQTTEPDCDIILFPIRMVLLNAVNVGQNQGPYELFRIIMPVLINSKRE